MIAENSLSHLQACKWVLQDGMVRVWEVDREVETGRLVSVLDPPFGQSLGDWNACGNFKTTSC